MKRAFLLAASFTTLAVAAFLMYARQLEVEVSGGAKVAVLVVSKAVKQGAAIDEADLSVREVPMAWVGERAIRARDRAKVLGVRVTHDLEPQETMEWQDLALAGADARHLSDLVQPGSRALTLHIPPSYMSVELLRPGDYVDILGVVDEQKGTPHVVVLLQRVLVLAVGSETTALRDPRDGKKATTTSKADELLTISVTLQESQTVALAAQKGPVIAVLRSAADPSVAAKIPALSQLVTRDPAPPTARDVAAPQKLVPPPAKTSSTM